MSSNQKSTKSTRTAHTGGGAGNRTDNANKKKSKSQLPKQNDKIEEHMDSNVKILLDEASELRAKIMTLEEENKGLEDENRKLKEGNKGVGAVDRSDFEKQLSDLKNENDKIKATIKEKNTEILKLQKELEDANEQKRALSTQKVSDQQSQVQNRDLEKKLKENEEAMKDLQEKCQNLQEQVDGLKSERGANVIEKQTLPPDSTLTDLTQDLNKAKQKCKQTESKVEELQNQVKSKEKEIQDLNRKIAEWKTENDKENISKLRNEEQLKRNNEEVESLKKELETLKSDKKRLTAEKDTIEKEIEKHLKEKRSLKDEIAQLQKQKTAEDKTPSTSTNSDRNLKQKYEQTYKELNDARAEISELKNRLSQAVGAKIMDNNPNITDLSDENRPTKLAEKYSELYDNEWTDAYEEVENEFSNEQDTIKHIYQRLLDVFDFCQKSSEEYSKSLKSCALGPPSLTVENGKAKAQEIGVTRVRQLKELKKSFSPFLVKDIFQNYVKNRKLKLEKKAKTEAFIKKCVEICWLMSSQDPPVILDTGNVKKPFDGDRYRTYTKTGKTVDFVVWPPMLLHKDGPLLSKGVAQGK